MPNDFQVNFLNGLEMARSTQGAKLDAMQRAASMQYQISAKQMDFQMGLLKLRESQAAQAVEMRMAQDEHQLKLKDFALRAEQSKMNSEILSIKMEEEKAATAAGSLYQQIAVSARNRGILPGSPEAFQYADFVLGENETFNGGDPRVLARARAVHAQEREAFVANAKKQGTSELAKLYEAQREPGYGPEGTLQGYRQVDDLYFRDKLESVAAAFRPAAKLGDSYAQEQLGLIEKKISGLGAPAAGVKPAANAGGSLLSEYGATKPMGRGFTGGDTDAQVDEAVSALSRSEAKKYTDTARTKLETAYQGYLQTGDSRSAKIVASRLAKLDLLQQAVNAPGERVDQLDFPSSGKGYLPGQGGQRLSYQTETTYTPTKMDLWNLSQMTDPEAMVSEIDAILQRRQVTRDPDGKNLRRLSNLMY